MTEKKIVTPNIAKDCWEEMTDPSCRRVEEKLKAAGYAAPSYRTIHKWQTAAGNWKTAKSTKQERAKLKRAMDDASPALTGDPRSAAEDILQAAIKALPPPDGDEAEQQADADAPDDPWIQEVRNAITGDVSDEVLLSVAARTTLRTAIAIEAALGRMAPQLIAVAPEAVGKLQLAVAESLKAAGEPFDRIGAARERAMKTINGGGGDVIPPGQDDPLADSLAAFRRRHAA